ISDLTYDTEGFIYNTEETITAEGLESINNKIFKTGTLLLAIYGSVGKVSIAGKELSSNQAILGISPKFKELIDIKFLKYWFISSQDRLINDARGVALKNISATIVKNLQIPLPPLPVQRRIAAILDAADEHRRKTQALIEKYDELA